MDYSDLQTMRKERGEEKKKSKWEEEGEVELYEERKKSFNHETHFDEIGVEEFARLDFLARETLQKADEFSTRQKMSQVKFTSSKEQLLQGTM